jgi:two-component system, cell cycle response regulator
MLLKGKRIFVLECDTYSLALMSTILRDEGAVIQIVRWGTDTLMRLREFQPVDAILLDILLPNQSNGYDVYDEIRAEPDLAHLPMVMVTAADRELERERSRSKGFDGFITKPVHFSTFGRQVAAAMAGQPVPVGQ